MLRNLLSILTVIVVLSANSISYADEFNASAKPTQMLGTTEVAKNCRPENALPPGSYKNSCKNCKVLNCDYLTCRCDSTDTSIDMTTCPENTYSNVKGELRCGVWYDPS